MWGELARGIQMGDGYLYSIMVLAFLATVVIFERITMLYFVFHIDFKKFLSNLKKMITADDVDRAITLCKTASRTSLPRITLRALEAAETDPTTIKGTIEEETIAFLPNLERRLNMLPAIATIILLLGILGTIDGLWNAFHSINVLDTAKKQASLSQGISGSLNPTALGLLVSMFILASYQLLKGIAIRLTEEVHHGVAVLHNLLVPQEAPAYVAMGEMPAMHASAPPPDENFVEENPPATEQNDAAGEEEDAFDDASVEDIKDEEEII